MADPDTAPEHGAIGLWRPQPESRVGSERELKRATNGLAARRQAIASAFPREGERPPAPVRVPSRRLCGASGARLHANRPDREPQTGADAPDEPLLTRRAMQLTTTRPRAQF